MITSAFQALRNELALCQSGLDNSDIVSLQLRNLFAAILEDFSFVSFELFELYRSRTAVIVGDQALVSVPSFITHDFLETNFAKDPSDYGVALALGVKQLRVGNRSRAKQLIQRVARSGYKERSQALHLLRMHFPDVVE